MTDLGSLGVLSPNAVNDNGQVVGVNTDRHAVLWTLAGGPVDLGTLGGDVSAATDINASGAKKAATISSAPSGLVRTT